MRAAWESAGKVRAAVQMLAVYMLAGSRTLLLSTGSGRSGSGWSSGCCPVLTGRRTPALCPSHGSAGVPAPELLLRVGGRHQGLLLSFASEAGSAAAVQALRGAKLRLSGFLPGPPNLSVDAAPGPPAAGPPAGPAAAAAEANGPMHGGGPPRGVPAEGPGPGAPPPPGGPPQEPRLPPPEYMSRTLWVGQVRGFEQVFSGLRVLGAEGEIKCDEGCMLARHSILWLNADLPASLFAQAGCASVRELRAPLLHAPAMHCTALGRCPAAWCLVPSRLHPRLHASRCTHTRCTAHAVLADSRHHAR